MSARNEPPPAGELLRWGATLDTMRECDKAAGIADKGTEAATSAFGRACQSREGSA